MAGSAAGAAGASAARSKRCSAVSTAAAALQLELTRKVNRLTELALSLDAAHLGGGLLQELADNLQLVETLLEALPVPVIVTDRADRALRLNAAWESLTGRPRAPQIGQPVGGVVRVNFPPDLERVESRLSLGRILICCRVAMRRRCI